MIEKYCVVIDDDFNIEPVKNGLVQKALETGINLNVKYLNPQEDNFLKNNGGEDHPNFVIDVAKVVDALKSREFNIRKIDMIACDYQLGDDIVNDFEIIRLLRNEINYQNDIILFSANMEVVIKNILSDGNLDKQVRKLKSLASVRILDYCDRVELKDNLVPYIKKQKNSLESEIESLLYKYKDWTFNSVFPNYKNRKISEIIEILKSNAVADQDFKRAFLENAIAHFIELNKEFYE